MSWDDLIARSGALFSNNYGAPGLALVSGDGVTLRDPSGREYLDFGSGISVNSFGHRHPEIRRAIDEQLDTLWHTSNLYASPTPVALAGELIESSFAERVFFCNSGAEANEAAIKTVRLAASVDRPAEKRNILTFRGGFHGRTLAALTATAQPRYQKGFEPLPGGFRYCDFNDAQALADALDDSVCAVLVEPVQGEGGVVPADRGFLAHLRAECDRVGALLVFDEVQCGVARTGRLWAHEWAEGVVPDAMTLAKALGGGLPIGALLLGPRLAEVLVPGSHGSTFGGNPVACAAARAALRLARSERLQGNVNAQSTRLIDGLRRIDERFGCFELIRGRGLMLGAVMCAPLREKLAALIAHCREEGLLVLQAGPDVLRLLPPLTITSSDVDLALQRIEAAVARLRTD